MVNPMIAPGQLVHYRKLSSDKFTARAVPGIFAGWRFDGGLAHRKMVYVLDYEALQHKTGGTIIPLQHQSQNSISPKATLYFLCGPRLRSR
jgi:hypothetical protein